MAETACCLQHWVLLALQNCTAYYDLKVQALSPADWILCLRTFMPSELSWNCVHVIMFVWVVFPWYTGLSERWAQSLWCRQSKLLNIHIPGARQNTVGVRWRSGRPEREVRPGNCSAYSPLTKPGPVGFARSHFIFIQDHGVDDSWHVQLVGSGTRSTGSTGFAPFGLSTNTTSY